MKLIVITSEQFLENEAEALNRLFQSGLEILHLRKPYSDENQYEDLLQQIEKEYHSNIVLHEHFSLTEKYKLNGVHLNRRNPSFGNNKKLSLSCSCHSFEELKTIDDFEYVFLSPIFNSISKDGYFSNFSENELQDASNQGIINQKVIALGGIDISNIHLLKQYKFGGAAVLGCLWKSFEENSDLNNLKKDFKALQSAINNQ